MRYNKSLSWRSINVDVICSVSSMLLSVYTILCKQAGQVCMLWLSEGFRKCPRQWQYSIDFSNHFEVIMQEYAEWAPRGTTQNAFCSATVWSQLPSDIRQWCSAATLCHWKAPTRHIKYGHWGMDLNATVQHQIQTGLHTLLCALKFTLCLSC